MGSLLLAMPKLHNSTTRYTIRIGQSLDKHDHEPMVVLIVVTEATAHKYCMLLMATEQSYWKEATGPQLDSRGVTLL